MLIYDKDRAKGGLYGGAVCGAILGILAHDAQAQQTAAKEFSTIATGGGVMLGNSIVSVVNTALALTVLARKNPDVSSAVTLGLIIGGVAGFVHPQKAFDAYSENQDSVMFQDHGANVTENSLEIKFSGVCSEYTS